MSYLRVSAVIGAAMLVPVLVLALILSFPIRSEEKSSSIPISSNSFSWALESQVAAHTIRIDHKLLDACNDWNGNRVLLNWDCRALLYETCMGLQYPRTSCALYMLFDPADLTQVLIDEPLLDQYFDMYKYTAGMHLKGLTIIREGNTYLLKVGTQATRVLVKNLPELDLPCYCGHPSEMATNYCKMVLQRQILKNTWTYYSKKIFSWFSRSYDITVDANQHALVLFNSWYSDTLTGMLLWALFTVVILRFFVSMFIDRIYGLYLRFIDVTLVGIIAVIQQQNLFKDKLFIDPVATIVFFLSMAVIGFVIVNWLTAEVHDDLLRASMSLKILTLKNQRSFNFNYGVFKIVIALIAILCTALIKWAINSLDIEGSFRYLAEIQFEEAFVIMVSLWICLFLTMFVKRFFKKSKYQKSKVLKAYFAVFYPFCSFFILYTIVYFVPYKFFLNSMYIYLVLIVFFCVLVATRDVFCFLINILYNAGSSENMDIYKFNILMKFGSWASLRNVLNDYILRVFLVVILPALSGIFNNKGEVGLTVLLALIAFFAFLHYFAGSLANAFATVQLQFKTNKLGRYNVRVCTGGEDPSVTAKAMELLFLAALDNAKSVQGTEHSKEIEKLRNRFDVAKKQFQAELDLAKQQASNIHDRAVNNAKLEHAGQAVHTEGRIKSFIEGLKITFNNQEGGFLVRDPELFWNEFNRVLRHFVNVDEVDGEGRQMIDGLREQVADTEEFTDVLMDMYERAFTPHRARVNAVNEPVVPAIGEVDDNIQIAERRLPERELNPLQGSYVTNILAESADHACAIASHQLLSNGEIGEEHRYRGFNYEYGTVRAPGEWQVMCIDNTTVTVNNKGYQYVTDFFSVFVRIVFCLVSYFREAYSAWKQTLLFNNQKELSQEFIDYLGLTTLFPDDKVDIKNLIFNQSSLEGLNASQVEMVNYARDVTKLTKLSIRGKKQTYIYPSAKEILNSYNEIMKKRLGNRKFEDATSNNKLLTLDHVYGNIRRPFMYLPKVLPKGFKLIAIRRKINICPVDCNFGGAIELERITSPVGMCVTANSIGNYYVSGHETQRTHTLHDCQKCPALVRCTVTEGWVSKVNVSVPFRLVFTTFVSGEAEFVVSQVSRSFDAMLRNNDLTVPVRGLYYLCEPESGVRVSNLIAAKASSETYLLTAAHTIAVRADDENYGPGKWGSVKILRDVDEAKLKALSMSSTAEVDVVMSKAGKFYCPRWFIVKDFCANLYLGRVKEIDDEGATVTLYNTERKEITPDTELSITTIDMHSQVSGFRVVGFAQNANGEQSISINPMEMLNSPEHRYDLFYNSTFGDSGSGVIAQNLVYAIHLGGCVDGTGAAMVTITSNGNKANWGKVLMLNQKQNNDFVYNCPMQKEYLNNESMVVPSDVLNQMLILNQNEGETYENKSKESITGEIRDWYVKKDNNTNYSLYFNSNGQHRVAFYNSLEKLNDFLSTVKGDRIHYISSDGLTPIITEDEGYVSDQEVRLIENQMNTMLNLINGQEYGLRNIYEALSPTIVNQLQSIDFSKFKDLSSAIGEDSLRALLQKSIVDITNIQRDLIVRRDELVELHRNFKNALAKITNSKEYVERKRAFDKSIEEFLDQRASYEEAMVAYLALKSQYTNEIKEWNNKIKEINDDWKSKKNQLANRKVEQAYHFQASIKDLKETIDELRRQRAKIVEESRKDPVDKESLEVAHRAWLEAKANFERAQQEMNIKKKFLEKERNSGGTLVKEHDKKTEAKMEELNVLKSHLKNLNVEHAAQMAALNAEKKERLARLEAPTKAKAPETPQRPKFVEDPDVKAIEETLTNIKKGTKEANRMLRVINALLENERKAVKAQELQSAAEVSEEVVNESGLTVFNNDQHFDIVFADFELSERQYIGNVVASIMWMPILDAATGGRWDDCLHTNPEFYEKVTELYRDGLAVLMNKLGLEEVVLMDTNAAKAFLDNMPVVDQLAMTYEIFNQGVRSFTEGINRRYVLITPSNINSHAFLQNIPARYVPAAVACRTCNIDFVCDQSHLKMQTGTMMDLVCTMECEKKQVQLLREHLPVCSKVGTGLMSTVGQKSKILGCPHNTVIRAKNVCNLHVNSDHPCILEKFVNGSVSILVENSEFFIKPECFVAFVYKMCDGHDLDHCDDPFTQADIGHIQGSVFKSNDKGFIPIGENTYVDLSFVTPLVRSRMLVKFGDLLPTFPIILDVEVKNQVILNHQSSIIKMNSEKIMALEDKLTALMSRLDQVLQVTIETKETVAAKRPDVFNETEIEAPESPTNLADEDGPTSIGDSEEDYPVINQMDSIPLKVVNQSAKTSPSDEEANEFLEIAQQVGIFPHTEVIKITGPSILVNHLRVTLDGKDAKWPKIFAAYVNCFSVKGREVFKTAVLNFLEQGQSSGKPPLADIPIAQSETLT